MKRHLTLFALIAYSIMAHTAVSADTPYLFGVLSEGLGNPFLVRYVEGKFRSVVSGPSLNLKQRREALSGLVKEYPRGSSLAGFTPDGRAVEVTIDAIIDPNGGIGESLFQVHAIPEVREPVFFTTFAAGSIRPLPTSSPKLGAMTAQMLRQRAASLFARALPHYMDSSIGGTLTINQLTTVRVSDVPEFIVVIAQCVILWRDKTKDDRCSLLFVIRQSDSSVLFERFGHPEWAPISSDLVATIKPLLFFKIATSNMVYFFGNYDGPWESGGRYGIFEFPTARLVAESY